MVTVEHKQRLHIGELAAEFGINPKTIRYYEAIGLMTPPERTLAGYRRYTDAEREQLHFIIKAKATGLTLEEIGEVLTLRRRGEMPCQQVLAILDRKLALVNQQIAALMDFREELRRFRAGAAESAGDPACVCGIIEQHEPVHQPAITGLRLRPEVTTVSP